MRRNFRPREAGRDNFVLCISHSCDIFNVDKFLLNEVEIRIKCVRSKDSFCLLGSDNGQFKVKIRDATLLVRKVKINPGILMLHAKELMKTPARYPITRVETKVLTIPANVTTHSMDNVFLGIQPRRLVLGFVLNKSFNGCAKLNPFKFDHFNINFLSIYIDGEQIPSRPLEPDFSNGLYIQAYNTLFSGTGIHYQDEGNNISRSEYASGNTLFAFDLTSDMSGNVSSHWNMIRQGNLRIEVQFAGNLANPINCIAYAEFDSLIQIDSDRRVTCNF